MQQTPPPLPSAPKPFVVQITPAGVPQTLADLRALESRRGQLSDQLVSAANRRKSLADQLRTSDAAARPGLEERMRVLDQRIVRLEQEIDQTGDALANAPAAVIAATRGANPAELFNRVSSDIVPIVAIVSVFVLAPIALTVSRLIWKRASAPPRPAIADSTTMNRLEQLQQAVDTIAIEVERISEGQRFVTRLLGEQSRPALGAGVAEPIRVAQKSGVPGERG